MKHIQVCSSEQPHQSTRAYDRETVESYFRFKKNINQSRRIHLLKGTRNYSNIGSRSSPRATGNDDNELRNLLHSLLANFSKAYIQGNIMVT